MIGCPNQPVEGHSNHVLHDMNGDIRNVRFIDTHPMAQGVDEVIIDVASLDQSSKHGQGPLAVVDRRTHIKLGSATKHTTGSRTGLHGPNIRWRRDELFRSMPLELGDEHVHVNGFPNDFSNPRTSSCKQDFR